MLAIGRKIKAIPFVILNGGSVEDKEIIRNLGKIEGMISTIVSNTENTNTQLLTLAKVQTDNKDTLQKQISKNREDFNLKLSKVKQEQSRFAVWVRLVAIAVGSTISILVRKTFF